MCGISKLLYVINDWWIVTSPRLWFRMWYFDVYDIMDCSKVGALVFMGLMIMTAGFVLTLAGWFAPAIKMSVVRVRTAGPSMLLFGFSCLVLSCIICSVQQRRCSKCCLYCCGDRKPDHDGSDEFDSQSSDNVIQNQYTMASPNSPLLLRELGEAVERRPNNSRTQTHVRAIPQGRYRYDTYAMYDEREAPGYQVDTYIASSSPDCHEDSPLEETSPPLPKYPNGQATAVRWQDSHTVWSRTNSLPRSGRKQVQRPLYVDYDQEREVVWSSVEDRSPSRVHFRLDAKSASFICDADRRSKGSVKNLGDFPPPPPYSDDKEFSCRSRSYDAAMNSARSPDTIHISLPPPQRPSGRQSPLYQRVNGDLDPESPTNNKGCLPIRSAATEMEGTRKHAGTFENVYATQPDYFVCRSPSEKIRSPVLLKDRPIHNYASSGSSIKSSPSPRNSKRSNKSVSSDEKIGLSESTTLTELEAEQFKSKSQDALHLHSPTSPGRIHQCVSPGLARKQQPIILPRPGTYISYHQRLDRMYPSGSKTVSKTDSKAQTICRTSLKKKLHSSEVWHGLVRPFIQRTKCLFISFCK